MPIPDISTAPPELLNRPYREAPPAPSAQEWAAAASYTLKNSKRYRHNWGQHLRSLMGTAHEGPEQGAVRFRIEIAPSGALARLDTLWSTSPAVEQRARAAVRQMPPLPPTPTGQPLVFEKTIVFDPWTAEAPPLYKNDCDPDPPAHGNRFVWDGRSPQVVAEQAVAEKLDPVAYAECLRQLPQDSIEAEAAKKIQRLVKDSKIKVQASIQGDAIRVNGTKRDDLQAVMAFKQPPSLTGWDALAKKADELEGRFGLEFGEFVKRLKEANLHSNNRLLI